MIGALIVLINAGAMALTIHSETWWLLPLNIAGMLIGLLTMASEF